MTHIMRLVSGLVAMLLASAAATAHTTVPIEGEPSRRELARYAMQKHPVRAIPRKFVFPANALQGSIFGIDVSHHQGNINWDKIAGQGVRFAYVKATQGGGYHDGNFAVNWSALNRLRVSEKPVLRGAYHFMSAVDTPENQAANHIATVGTLGAADLPPCLDIEWDFLRKDNAFVLNAKGEKIDQWAALSSAEIVRRAKVWLLATEKATGKKPIIYTNALWWRERVGDDLALAGYKLWIADYPNASLAQDTPTVPPKFDWVLWQLTDLGTVGNAGFEQDIDTNMLAPGNHDLSSWFK